MWFILWEVQQEGKLPGDPCVHAVPFPQPPGWPPPPARWLQHIQAQCNTAPRTGRSVSILVPKFRWLCLQNPRASCRCLTQVHSADPAQPWAGRCGLASSWIHRGPRLRGNYRMEALVKREGMQRPGRQSASPTDALHAPTVRLCG